MTDDLTNPKRKIEMSPIKGLKIYGDTGFELNSLLNAEGEKEYMKITSKNLSIFRGTGTESDDLLLSLGLVEKGVTVLKDPSGEGSLVMNHGLYIQDGGFLLSTKNMPRPPSMEGGLQDITVSPAGILLEKEEPDEDGKITACQITADGISFLRDGEVIYTLNNRIEVSSSRASSGKRINFGRAFREDPTVIVIPSKVKTYEKEMNDASQFIDVSAEDVDIYGFTPRASLIIAAKSLTAISNSNIPKGLSNGETWEATTVAKATSLEIRIFWYARKAAFLRKRDYVRFRVDFDYGNGWVLGAWQRREGEGMFGDNNSGSKWFSSAIQTTARNIKVRVVAEKPRNPEFNTVRVDSVKYESNTFIALDSGNEEELPLLHWIAVGR
jgi:hypothetical protein